MEKKRKAKYINTKNSRKQDTAFHSGECFNLNQTGLNLAEYRIVQFLCVTGPVLI